MKDLQEVFAGLSQLSFRSKFRLQPKEKQYLYEKGIDEIARHAMDFIEKRLAAAYPLNDGKQTPWRNHPVFVAQPCCRGCLKKWHGIARGNPLNEAEKHHIVEAIKKWLSQYIPEEHPFTEQTSKAGSTS